MSPSNNTPTRPSLGELDEWNRTENVRLIRAVAGCSDRYMPKTPPPAHSFPSFPTLTATVAPNPATKGDLGPSQPAPRDSQLGFYTLDALPASGGASRTWARGGYRFWLHVRGEPGGAAATSARGTRKERTKIARRRLVSLYWGRRVWSPGSRHWQPRPPTHAPASSLTTREQTVRVGSHSLLARCRSELAVEVPAPIIHATSSRRR